MSPRPSFPEYFIDEAGEGDWYFNIPDNLARDYLVSQRLADEFHAMILRHVKDRLLQEHPPERP